TGWFPNGDIFSDSRPFERAGRQRSGQKGELTEGVVDTSVRKCQITLTH
mgnify:CR=1